MIKKRIKKASLLGVIAEDQSDIDCISVFVKRIANQSKIKILSSKGDGCGKIIKKCRNWAEIFRIKGASRLMLVHDLDKKTVTKLHKDIEEALDPCPIEKYLISIPIEELEAWLLSDSFAIKSAFNLRITPRIRQKPENIQNPKEYLGEIIRKASNGDKLYLNTRDNIKISRVISIDHIKKNCPSFLPFYDFVKKYY